MSGSLGKSKLSHFTIAGMLTFFLASCASTSAVPGVPHGIVFDVTPIYPASYQIVASGGYRKVNVEILKSAWRKKAEQLAGGRTFTASELIVRDTESVPCAPQSPIVLQGRYVVGTMNIARP